MLDSSSVKVSMTSLRAIYRRRFTTRGGHANDPDVLFFDRHGEYSPTWHCEDISGEAERVSVVADWKFARLEGEAEERLWASSTDATVCCDPLSPTQPQV